MGKILGVLFGLVLLAAVIVVNSAAYTVEPRQQVIVLQFGEVKHIVTEPGLHWKTPFIQSLVTLEAKRRLIELDIDPVEIITKEKKRLVVDAFARYRIEDPLLFYTNLRSIEGARGRLSGWLHTAMKNVASKTSFEDIIKDDRVGTMNLIETEFKKAAESKGISVQDVKFKRADLPDDNARAVFARMQTERERDAKGIRAEGEKEAAKIRTDADRQVVEIKADANSEQLEILSQARVDANTITSDAEKKARKIRGEAEAAETEILADAYGKGGDFYFFYRQQETYRGMEGQTIVWPADTSIWDVLLRDGGDQLGKTKPPGVAGSQ